MKLKKIIKSNKFLYYIARQIRKIQYYLIPMGKFRYKRFLRSNGILKNKYIEKIKDYKDKHKGQRCFIIATGPSLTVEDLEKLKNEITFGMNSISKIGEKTDWRPTYYGIQDEFVYEKLKDSILKIDKNITIFTSDVLAKKKKLLSNNIVQIPLYCMDHLINPNSSKFKFSNNCHDIVYDGYSITYTLMQLAVYMGFNKIYLLGADCSYAKNGPQHFIETGVNDLGIDFITERLFNSYQVAKKSVEENGVKIYNATRGGCLEIFPRVSMDEI
ncbi:DUF115 domain-containing protein [Clostridium sp. SHJSY1]|uniref:6-hydroxymethylpterin diphosphokinase MptE-like protein n=1 Tax=Clostridium sp. SHJSY1 TaxID=2942483 RepID=UPI0028770AFE|nr:6-hydroxymethylpterin diphosphokinase MptE-like protein [Clostridium sp. SHJSY1]MDS0526525.1 DUF115 domain-containing protein [Clostridium sp. SHJSY1]